MNSIEKLGYFNYKDRTELFVDASPFGLGAVLAQFNTAGVPRIIACISKSLTVTERRYPRNQKEALAIVWAVERFKYYLTSINFTIWTDSTANMFIFGGQFRSGKRSITRAESWALRLQPFNFQIRCVPGVRNIADVVSRLISKCQADEPFDKDEEEHMASEEDKELAEVRRSIETGKWPRHLSRYECLEKQLRTLDPLDFKDNLIVLPILLRKKAIETSHEGHVGCGATKRILREHFWWPNMSKEAQEFVSSCATCLAISRRNPPVPLCSRQLSEGPWEILQVDFLSLQGCGSGHFLICVDNYSRYLHVVQLKSTDAKSTNTALCNIFKLWGLPDVIQSDNGPPFKSKEFTDFWDKKGVKIHKSIPLSAQSNGAVERQNQGIGNFRGKNRI
uniref:RNA-directed DNA polymerase n=1 Tax=Anopheles stephensi TaxID=30069 RepID=A0A182YMW3_ANOST